LIELDLDGEWKKHCLFAHQTPDPYIFTSGDDTTFIFFTTFSREDLPAVGNVRQRLETK